MDDNIIIGKSTRYTFVVNRPLEDHFRAYVAGTLVGLVSALNECGFERISQDLEGPDTREVEQDPDRYRLGDIEFYWEFDHPTPVTLVDTLTHYLPRVAARMRVTKRDLERSIREVSQQSQSATVYLTRKRQLRIYAKTNRRVRMEVTFPDGYRSSTHRTSEYPNLAALTSAVNGLATEAADTLNTVLDHLWKWTDIQEAAPTPDQLRAEIARAARNPFDATTIIYNLAKHGRIALAAGDGLRETVVRLTRIKQPVLQTVGRGSSIYEVTPLYEYARRNLDIT